MNRELKDKLKAMLGQFDMLSDMVSESLAEGDFDGPLTEDAQEMLELMEFITPYFKTYIADADD